MIYQIKRNNVVIFEHEIKGKRTQSAPAVDFIDIEFDYYRHVVLRKNDTIMFNDQPYYCDKQGVSIFKKSTNLYTHRAKFVSINYRATEIALLDPNGAHRFEIEGNLLTLGTLAVNNLNRVSSGWGLSMPPTTITKKFEIKDENVMSFLAKLSGEFEIPFLINNKNVTFGEIPYSDSGLFKYGKGNGFLDLKKSYRGTEKVPNTIHASGGNGLVLDNPIQDDDNVDENGVIEGFYVNERIFPTTQAVVKRADTVLNERFFVDLDYYIPNQFINGQTALINFETGALAGLSFYIYNVQYNTELENVVNLRPRLVDGIEYPNATVKAQEGDRFNITNITMPQEVIDDAKERLETATTNYLRNLIDRNLVIEANLDPLYNEYLKVNDRIEIYDEELDINGYFIINETRQDLQDVQKKELTLDYVGNNLLNLSLPVVNDNILNAELEMIGDNVMARLPIDMIQDNLVPFSPLSVPNVEAVNNGLNLIKSVKTLFTSNVTSGGTINLSSMKTILYLNSSFIGNLTLNLASLQNGSEFILIDSGTSGNVNLIANFVDRSGANVSSLSLAKGSTYRFIYDVDLNRLLMN